MLRPAENRRTKSEIRDWKNCRSHRKVSASSLLVAETWIEYMIKKITLFFIGIFCVISVATLLLYCLGWVLGELLSSVNLKEVDTRIVLGEGIRQHFVAVPELFGSMQYL